MRLALVQVAKAPCTVVLRVALAAGFLAAVTDRFGVWGPPGSANVAWGDFQRFTAYTGLLNPWAPTTLIPAIAWFVTGAEIVLASMLIAGIATRYVAVASGALLALFALGMTVGTGVKSALNYSVFAAAAGGFALATADSYPWSLDALLALTGRLRGHARGSQQSAGTAMLWKVRCIVAWVFRGTALTSAGAWTFILLRAYVADADGFAQVFPAGPLEVGVIAFGSFAGWELLGRLLSWTSPRQPLPRFRDRPREGST
jgi:thiosulfate dehydrogenase [quinone] large subunit